MFETLANLAAFIAFKTEISLQGWIIVSSLQAFFGFAGWLLWVTASVAFESVK